MDRRLLSQVSLDEAAAATRTGDIWIFRGESTADRAIQTLTNSPVNHVGMSVVIDDLPPLMWHAELGHSLQDMWTGRFQRGVQLHDLRSAVQVWGAKYGQRGWLRQLDHEITREQEDALLKTIARLDGTPFPSTAKLASRWFGVESRSCARSPTYRQSPPRAPTAPKWLPRPMKRWVCLSVIVGSTGSTRANSGVEISCPSHRELRSVTRSR
ncbi:hypothetical protein GCM10020255_076780 [Rhodococcus baikonurensis]